MEPILQRMVSLPLFGAEVKGMLEEAGVLSAVTIAAATDAHSFATLVGRLIKKKADKDPSKNGMAERCVDMTEELKQLWELANCQEAEAQDEALLLARNTVTKRASLEDVCFKETKQVAK